MSLTISVTSSLHRAVCCSWVILALKELGWQLLIVFHILRIEPISSQRFFLFRLTRQGLLYNPHVFYSFLVVTSGREYKDEHDKKFNGS